MEKIKIIAEAGTNNNGQYNQAIALMDIAKRCQADFIKFQIIYTDGLYLPGSYEYGHYDIDDVRKIRDKGIMTDVEYKRLNDYGHKLNLPFTASIFDKRGLDLVLNLNVPFIKIASGDLNNLHLLRQVAKSGKKIILSTGMSTLEDIKKSVDEIIKIGNEDIVLMHCVSIYPADTEQTNLRFIEVLIKEFGLPVGFSDHTETSLAACMALSLGATWFEKHFTEDRGQVGLDHAHAMEENGLKKYINDLRASNKALELKKTKVGEAELFTRKRARRSLYAAIDIKPGELITEKQILIVRPENLMDAADIDLIVGSIAKTTIKQYEPFSLEKVTHPKVKID